MIQGPSVNTLIGHRSAIPESAAQAADLLQVAETLTVTEAEGPGRRFAVWVQGCPLRCPGCCNPEMLPFRGGRPVPVGRLLREIRRAAEQHGIEGVTLLGGEPFAQAAGAATLAEGVQRRGLTVIVFTGYTLEKLRAMRDRAVDELLSHTDVLVDGPYVEELPETRRRWIGSANQRVNFLTDRCRPDDPCWQSPNSLEIRLRGGELSVNGFPARAASGLWKRVRPLSRWTRTEGA
ncbi:MAG TPA: 4Fe-4S single cluster domain-containing protein [Thermoguttaceae bacterium]|nr:4Fe-4S single cluster domain-containing protein [Thermoguttaceae bacterium]